MTYGNDKVKLDNVVFKSEQEYNQYQMIIKQIIHGELCASDFGGIHLDHKKFLAALIEYNERHPNEKIHCYTGWEKFWRFGEANAEVRRRNQLGKMLENRYTKNLNRDQKREKRQKPVEAQHLLDISNIHNRWDFGFKARQFDIG